MGAGCANCQGSGYGDGVGMGEGQGAGARPLEENDTDFYRSRTRQKPDKGKAVVAGSVKGRNLSGNAREEVKSLVESARNDPSDPLTNKRLPRAQRDQVREYFESFVEGEN